MNIRILAVLFIGAGLALAQGTITTVAGKGTAINSDGGPAGNAILGVVHGVTVDGAGNLYVAETAKGLRKINTQGIISTIAPGLGPFGVAVDSAGNVYFSEDGLNIVDKADPAGNVTRVAGAITAGYSGDGGPATKAWLQTPYGVAVDGNGNVYIADYQNGRVRKVDALGIITTVAGNGSAVCCAGEGGPALQATIPLVEAVAVDNAGNLYIGQGGRVAKVDASGTFHTIAGLGFATDDNIPATSAYVFDTQGLAVDSAGTVYIATGAQYWLRKVTFPAVPSISSAVNGASFQGPIVPNSWATIGGSNLASAPDSWDRLIQNGRLPTSVEGVSVAIGSKPAYLSYISSGQLNLIVPDVAPGPQPVVVTNSAGTSATFTATVSEYGPAFFLWPGNQAVATRLDFTWAVKNGTFSGVPTTAAKPGDTIVLWGTGFGPTTPAAPFGEETPTDQPYATSTLPTVTIDDMPAHVYGAALAPGFAGLYQVAIQVPEALSAGDWPVVASIGGVSSPNSAILTVEK